MMINTATRGELISAWHENMNEMMDAFLSAGVDPDQDDTQTETIRSVIQQWIEDGDECAAS